jgi:hypothetical protein
MLKNGFQISDDFRIPAKFPEMVKSFLMTDDTKIMVTVMIMIAKLSRVRFKAEVLPTMSKQL